jgi:membrane-associated phospholipid phosphatase
VALLADLIHNFGDALTAVPLGIAFYLRSFRGEKVAGLFVVLAILVGADALTRLDQAAVDHVMPAVTDSGGREPTIASSAFPIFHEHQHRGHVVLAAVTYAFVLAGSVVPSILLVALCALALRRRGRGVLAAALVAVFVAANVVEVVGKATIARSALHLHRGGRPPTHIAVFDTSFPSGHATRVTILAFCFALCLPRLLSAAALWAAACAVLLVAGAWHTPTDVAGGVLLGTAAGLGALAVEGAQISTTPSGKLPSRSGSAFVTRKLSSTRRPPPPSQ